MAATVIINRYNGAGETATDITSTTTRLSQADSASPGTSNPIPAVGTLDTSAAVSVWAVTRLHASTTPSGTINNIKWYTNNPTLQTGVKLRGETATSYVQPVTTNLTFGAGGQLTTTTYSTMSAAGGANGSVLADPGAAGVYTSGSPKSVSGSISNPSTGGFGDRFVFQMQVASTASPGVISPTITVTWQYDET